MRNENVYVLHGYQHVNMYIRFCSCAVSVCTSISAHWMKMHMHMNPLGTFALCDDDSIREGRYHVSCVE